MIRRDGRSRAALLLCVALLYLALFAFLRTTTLYDVEGGHNDRLFSADDLYYVTEFFSAEPDDSPRIIKHPLLIVFGCLFTRAERLLLGVVSVRRHYQLIVLTQMLASVASVGYLDAILEKRHGLTPARARLLCAVYALAFSTLFYTFVAESYCYSALLLLMTFYYAADDRPVLTAALGVLAAGVTITNAALWAVIVLLSGETLRRRVTVLLAAGTAFCLLVALLPIGTVFFSTLLPGAMGSAQSYSDHFPPLEAAVRVFYMLICAPFFLTDLLAASPFGDFLGDALSLLPSAAWYITLLGLAWLALLLYAAVTHRRDRLAWAPLGVLAANLLLHGLIQYGLKEGFLYCLHHLGAQILLASLVLREGKAARVGVWLCAAMLVGEVLANRQGYEILLAFLAR